MSTRKLSSYVFAAVLRTSICVCCTCPVLWTWLCEQSAHFQAWWSLMSFTWWGIQTGDTCWNCCWPKFATWHTSMTLLFYWYSEAKAACNLFFVFVCVADTTVPVMTDTCHLRPLLTLILTSLHNWHKLPFKTTFDFDTDQSTQVT